MTKEKPEAPHFLTENERKEALFNFGSTVRRLRNDKLAISQETFAEWIGKGVEHVSFLERGERSPSFETILDIANALGVAPSQLFSSQKSELEKPLGADFPLPPTSPFPEPISETSPDVKRQKSNLERLEDSFSGLREMQKLADEYGVNDVLQDNGGKVLQVLILLGLRQLPGREGNDAVDDAGDEYELKTINRSLRKSAGITTHHHLNKTILAKYRAVKAWYIAIYEGIELKEIYKVLPEQLEELFSVWELKIETNGPLNNPKIPMRYVRKGTLVYPGEVN